MNDTVTAIRNLINRIKDGTMEDRPLSGFHMTQHESVTTLDVHDSESITSDDLPLIRVYFPEWKEDTDRFLKHVAVIKVLIDIVVPRSNEYYNDAGTGILQMCEKLVDVIKYKADGTDGALNTYDPYLLGALSTPISLELGDGVATDVSLTMSLQVTMQTRKYTRLTT